MGGREVPKITSWINQFLQVLDETFGERVWFAGLQGSYGRGEATETSDIDVVVILDDVSAVDLQILNHPLIFQFHQFQKLYILQIYHD